MHAMPVSLRWAFWLLAAQGVGLAALAAFLVYEDVTAPPENVGGAVAVTFFAALMAGLLGLLAWALGRRQGWARGPALVLQLLMLPMGYYMVTGGAAWLGVPVMAAGVGGVVALLAPTTRAALSGGR
jgi:hypothetical protein